MGLAQIEFTLYSAPRLIIEFAAAIEIVDLLPLYPGPGDPAFFDPDADEPKRWSMEKVDAEMEEAFRKAGTTPHFCPPRAHVMGSG